MNDYQEQILDHYHNPRNYYSPKWMPTHKAKLQNLSCGDELELFLLVEKDEIKEVAFQGEGCSISIASASLLTELIIGQDLNFIKNITSDKILSIIGIELTPTRMKCALLSLDTLNKALKS